MTRRATRPQGTSLSVLIRQAMTDAGMSYGEVEAAGGPSRQTTWNLVKRSRMARPPSDTTVQQLVKALPTLSDETVRQAIAESLGVAAEPAPTDDWSRLGRLLAEKASAQERDLVLAAARGMWEQLRKRRV